MFFALLYALITTILIFTVILFEQNYKKIIFWSLIIALTSIIGYLVYFIFFCDKGFVKKNLFKKQYEDNIYKSLFNFATRKDFEDSLMNFGCENYDAGSTQNNKFTLFANEEEYLTELSKNVNGSKNSILISCKYLGDIIKNEDLIFNLKEKQKMGVIVKIAYAKKSFKDRKVIKDLLSNNIRVSIFNKSMLFNSYYQNNKNFVVIDGRIAFFFSHIAPFKKKNTVIEYSNVYYMVEGDVLNYISFDMHQDCTFATQKFLSYQQASEKVDGNEKMQYLASSITNNLEVYILKALSLAKKEIDIHTDVFIPTESILAFLKMASKSNITVKVMISGAKKNKNYYASRNYLKEIACSSALCYLYDGIISSTFIIIDKETLILPSFTLDAPEINNNLHNVLIVKDADLCEKFTKKFDDCVNNCYRICKPRKVLLRERLFKKFI